MRATAADGRVYVCQLEAVVGSRSIVTPGLRELTALGFITRTRNIKRSTFMLSDQWQNVATQREALLISVNARLPPTHRKWCKPATADVATA